MLFNRLMQVLNCKLDGLLEFQRDLKSTCAVQLNLFPPQNRQHSSSIGLAPLEIPAGGGSSSNLIEI